MKKQLNLTFLIIALAISLIISSSGCNAAENQNFSSHDISIKVEKQGKILLLSGVVPRGVHEVELRIDSDRNKKISHVKEVSPNNPNQEINQRPGNIYYPVVDIILERGMEGMAGFSNCNNDDSCIINGPFYKRKQLVQPWLSIHGNVLKGWENSFFINTSSCQLNTFYIKKQYPLATRQLDIKIELLSEHWEGTISVYDVTNKKEMLFSGEILSGEYSPPYYFESGLDRDRLLKALEGCVGYTKRSQVKDPCFPTNGGLFLFYDLDAKLYRSDYWIWGWGPSVAMLLRASDILTDQKIELVQSAKEIGEASLRFLWKQPGSLENDIMISLWGRGLQYKDGYGGILCLADALFLAGWAWVPLYEYTGEKKYLDITAHHCQVADELLKEWIIIPHNYHFDEQRWGDWTIDETGFGVEGYAEIFRITPEKAYQDGGRIYIDRHLDLFERPDGLWNRHYSFTDSIITPTGHITRSLGWAMEGLLAAHRLLPEEGYLDKAKKMAKHLLDFQRPEGYWTFSFSKPVPEVGISEKGTALWSYLLYELYAATGEKVYLDAARKALKWCMSVQYDGSDPEAFGSVVGNTAQSAVGYRAWYNVSCTYTTAFMGLAILQELSLKDVK